MGYDNQTSSQQAQSDEPFFAVSKTVVFEGDEGPANTCSASSKLRPCLATFVRFFASYHSYFIPSQTHCIAVCSYKQIVEKIGSR